MYLSCSFSSWFMCKKRNKHFAGLLEQRWTVPHAFVSECVRVCVCCVYVRHKGCVFCVFSCVIDVLFPRSCLPVLLFQTLPAGVTNDCIKTLTLAKWLTFTSIHLEVLLLTSYTTFYFHTSTNTVLFCKPNYIYLTSVVTSKLFNVHMKPALKQWFPAFWPVAYIINDLNNMITCDNIIDITI